MEGQKIKDLTKGNKRSNKDNWCYQFRWYMTKHHEGENGIQEIEETERQMITQEILSLCEKKTYQVQRLYIKAGEIRLDIGTTSQIHTGKVLKNLQKIITKKGLIDLGRWEQIVTTTSKEEASKDIRIQKLLNDIWSASYYDLEEGLDENEVAQLKEIFSHRRLYVIEKEEQVYLIDQEALMKEINLNCFECTKKHPYGCCCGIPCGFSDKNLALFDQHMLEIEEVMKAMDEQQYKRLEEKGGFLTANGKLRAFDGHCSLLVEEDGSYKCIAHKYALDRSIPIYDLCPLSCLMYPLEVIELITSKHKKVYLFTSVVEEALASQIGRWGSYDSLQVELRCIHKEAHNDFFKKEAYRPVYKVNEGLIQHEFGEYIGSCIKEVLEQ